MKRSEILQKLEERLARGEISEKTYIDIKARYDAEPEEPSSAEMPAPNLEASIHEAVARATEEAARTTEQAVRAAGEAMRAVDFSGIGAKISDESIKILGSGVVSGNPIKTVEFKAAGSAQVRGSLECETVKVSGSCDFDGDVQCVEFRSAGSSRIAGSLRAQDVDVSGSLQVGKDLQAVDIASSGSLRVNGDVSGQDFHSTGSIRIEGELRVVDVDIELGGSSRVKTIDGQDISVRTTGGFLRSRGDLTAERIVGQDVDLEGTTAAYVQGQDVRIGPHCRVDVIVAQELVVHESSEVKERRVQSG
jgi:cytoskeletal protein CcmA (bactofilin family)